MINSSKSLFVQGTKLVTLRCNGQVEFEGNGVKKLSIGLLKLRLCGSPDLVEVIAEGQPPRTLGTIDDIKWLPLMR